MSGKATILSVVRSNLRPIKYGYVHRTTVQVAMRSKCVLNYTPVSPLSLSVYRRTYSSEQSSMPSPPNLPDKQQIEKYFFKVVAFIWDVGYWLLILTKRTFEKYVLDNPTVQCYWKIFLDKMEKAKKD